jgi:hypothetical protein
MVAVTGRLSLCLPLQYILPGITLKKFYVWPSGCMYVVYVAQNKQRLFAYSTLIDWFLSLRECLLRGTNLIFKYNLCPISSLKFSSLYLIMFNNNYNHFTAFWVLLAFLPSHLECVPVCQPFSQSVGLAVFWLNYVHLYNSWYSD